jgi:hypothetical protein
LNFYCTLAKRRKKIKSDKNKGTAKRATGTQNIQPTQSPWTLAIIVTDIQTKPNCLTTQDKTQEV